MMKHKLLSLLLFPFSAWALSPNVTISDVLTNPDGSHPNGTITISWTRALDDNSPVRGTIFPGSQTITVTNGIVSTSLFPNGSMLPAGLCYGISQILNGVTSKYYWYLPTTTNTLTINQVQSQTGCPVPYTAIINPGQLLPGPPTGTTYLSSSSQGFVSWVPGSGGGGSPAFSAITGGVNNTAQTMTVGSSSVLNYSGTGIVAANQVLTTPITSLYGNSGKLIQGLGTFTLGDLGAFDASGNVIDSGDTAANMVMTTGSYADPSWITSLSGAKISGALGCGGTPTFTGDVSNSGCVVTATKTNGVAFAASATTDTTNAANISTGTLASARLPAINLSVSGSGGVTGNLQTVSINGGTGCSTATWVRGDMSCQTIPAGGTVTNSFGPLTAGAVMLGNAGNDSTVVPSLGTTSSVLTGNAGGSPSWSQVNLATTVSGLLPGTNGGTNNGFLQFSGPAGSLKTYTGPNANATILTSNAAVTMQQGGTGADFSAIAKGGILTGTAAGVLGITAIGATNGYVLTISSGSAGGVAWTAPTSGGTVTSIVFSSPLTGGTVTATGTVGCPTCATSAASQTTGQLLIGQGSQTQATLGSLGTTTTVLHGNSGGPPSFGSVVNVDTSLAASQTALTGTANGVNVSFTIGGTVHSILSVLRNGLVQDPNSAYSITGSTVTFTNNNPFIPQSGDDLEALIF